MTVCPLFKTLLLVLRRAGLSQKNGLVVIHFEEPRTDPKILFQPDAFLHDHFPALGRNQIGRMVGQYADKTVFRGKERVYHRSFVGGSLRCDDL